MEPLPLVAPVETLVLVDELIRQEVGIFFKRQPGRVRRGQEIAVDLGFPKYRENLLVQAGILPAF